MKKVFNLVKNPKRIIPVMVNKGLLNFLSDETILKIQYKDKMEKSLNLENPQTFNEKLQWLKLYNRKPYYTNLVDKYEVRKYVAETIGKEYLIPVIGVWDIFDDIVFSKLPNSFVLKCTHDSGGVIVCKDKTKFNKSEAKRKMDRCLKFNYYYHTREWPYKNVKPRIICEKYIVDESQNELKDYKFMCFNGEPKIIQVISERNNRNYYINHFDLDWNPINIPRKKYKDNDKTIEKPRYLEEMIAISRKLSKNTPFTRVDLYQTSSGVFFGEITFYPLSGYVDFKNEEDDYLLGSWITLPE